jgi:hypothetical protein
MPVAAPTKANETTHFPIHKKVSGNPRRQNPKRDPSGACGRCENLLKFLKDFIERPIFLSDATTILGYFRLLSNF